MEPHKTHKDTNHDLSSDQTDSARRRAKEKAESGQAANLIRQRLDSLYSAEPSAKEESSDAAQAQHRSKHQQFIYNLSLSGKTLAEIQTAWHDYYNKLENKEKLEVWDEFYKSNEQGSKFIRATTANQASANPVDQPEPKQPTHHRTTHRKHSVAEIKHRLLSPDSTKVKLKARQHFKSLLFGLSMGSLSLLILLFGFFNERFVAPFITPSRSVSSTPIIADGSSGSVGRNPLVIIPKINVEIPVVYDISTVAESAIQTALQRGSVHYATTATPGEKGNVVIFGHSSNNIFNPGKYKFAFVLLSRLENGDLFYLTKNSKRYVYKVYKKAIVQPNDVSVLESTNKTATATLITCDPPGTSLHRLVVVGEQISPDPAGNTASTAKKGVAKPSIIPSNAPSLWQRFKHWISS